MRLARAPLIDFMVIGDESLVMTEHQCLRLAAVPTALLVYLDQPRSVDQITVHLNEEFGPAPDGRIQEVISDLVRHHLILT